MGLFCNKTRLDTNLHFPLHFFNMACEMLSQASVIQFPSTCSVDGVIAYTLALTYQYRRKFNGFRSDDRPVTISYDLLLGSVSNILCDSACNLRVGTTFWTQRH
ncbi:hypothetical protein TNCV_3570901 [Trichonephila clavipes]|nr:hypothetical protein TNCV_3570901 [Trichonephila clavipes]